MSRSIPSFHLRRPSSEHGAAAVLFAFVAVGIVGGPGTLLPPIAPSRASPGAVASSAAPLLLAPLTPFSKIQHVIVLMMENRAYDTYFGAYCERTGPHCRSTAAGLSNATCVPLYPTRSATPCVVPYDENLSAATWQGQPDLLHTWTASHSAYDNGTMDGFYLAEQKRNLTFGHYNGSTLPVYWDMAEEFGLGDQFFSSTLTYSLPNHWYLVAGQSPNETMGPNYPVYTNLSADRLYLSEANTTPTIETELLRHPSVSWTYYDYNLTNYSQAVRELSGTDPGSAYLLWNPLAAPNQSYARSVPTHFRDRASFFTDLSNGRLANLSYLIPNGSFSDHLPSNITSGENYVASVVNALEASSYWNSTALFVTWDEYGGFYDHVAPPAVDSDGWGFRVPLLVFSPWTPAGLVNSRALSFESLLHFVEWRWGLGCLTSRDCTATLPTGFFDFSIHRAPVYFENANDSLYPYVAPPTGPPFIESFATSLGGSSDRTSSGSSPPDDGLTDWS